MTTRNFSETLPSPGETSWPRQIDIENGKIARDEATLTTMPFVRLRPDDRGEPVTFEWTAVGRDGKYHEFFQTFLTSSEKGLPGPTAGRVIMALFSISPGKIEENLQVKTHLNELTKLCRLSPGGSTNEALRTALDRLQGVTIKTNAFWDQAGGQYFDKSTIELFSSHHLKTTPSKTEIIVRWTPEITRLMNTWTKPANLNHIVELRSWIARRLYQISALGIYQEGQFIEDLKILCHSHLGISPSRQSIGRMKDTLKPPISSLKEKDLLHVSIEKAPNSPAIKSGWRVRARPAERMLETFEEIEDPQYWACHLANRGVNDLTDSPMEE